MYTGMATSILTSWFSFLTYPRIGRTGRVGNTGRATSFFDQHEDGAISRPLVGILTDAGQMVPDWLGMSRSRGGGW